MCETRSSTLTQTRKPANTSISLLPNGAARRHLSEARLHGCPPARHARPLTTTSGRTVTWRGSRVSSTAPGIGRTRLVTWAPTTRVTPWLPRKPETATPLAAAACGEGRQRAPVVAIHCANPLGRRDSPAPNSLLCGHHTIPRKRGKAAGHRERSGWGGKGTGGTPHPAASAAVQRPDLRLHTGIHAHQRRAEEEGAAAAGETHAVRPDHRVGGHMPTIKIYGCDACTHTHILQSSRCHGAVCNFLQAHAKTAAKVPTYCDAHT